MTRNRDRKVGGENEPRRAYAAPEIVSLSSSDLLELLGPAQGYGTGGGGRGSTGMSGDPSRLGFNKG